MTQEKMNRSGRRDKYVHLPFGVFSQTGYKSRTGIMRSGCMGMQKRTHIVQDPVGLDYNKYTALRAKQEFYSEVKDSWHVSLG